MRPLQVCTYTCGIIELLRVSVLEDPCNCGVATSTLAMKLSRNLSSSTSRPTPPLNPYLNLYHASKMPPNTLLKLVRSSPHQIAPRTSSSLLRAAASKRTFNHINRSMQIPIQTSRTFSSGRPALKGLSPESENPTPTLSPKASSTPAAPANLTAEQYNELSDAYMDALVTKLEELQDESENIDVDYSVLALIPNQ